MNMDREETLKRLGKTTEVVSFLVKEHEPTKTSFNIIKSQLKLFGDLVNEKSNNEVDIIQTGSSFDDLHFCRNMRGIDKEKVFIPPTDFDFMMVYNTFPIEDWTGHNVKNDKEGLSAALKYSKCAFLMIPSNHLGYVKLLVTDNGREKLQEKRHAKYIDADGLLRNNCFGDNVIEDPAVEIIYSRQPEIKFIVSGPAISNFEQELKGFTYDFVHAFPCREWPEVANRWSKRPRDAKWPDVKMVAEIMQDGCAVVPVGYYKSPDHEQEWRLSFNLSEKKLSLILSPNQKTCYCIVKLMIKEQLSPQAILSSYMVKNMMFWFCEQQYGDGEWEADHLGQRIVQLVDYICTALEHHNIPHYILPFNNLIRHKTKEEVKLTLDEIKKMKDVPFQTLTSICRKMRVFDVASDTKDVLAKGGEVKAMLTLFASLVQTLCQLGLVNLDAPQLATRCFLLIVAMNATFKSLIRHSSNLYAATTISELLKPFAIQKMQTGDVDDALFLFQIMYDTEKERVLSQYPETITNIACLYAYKMELVKEKVTRDGFAKKANEHFQLALKYIADSPSLHFAYGNFLRKANISIIEAIEQFKKAIAMDGKREDDEALIQITLPGKSEKSESKTVYSPGKVVAYYSAINALVDIDELFEARTTARKFEAFVYEMELKTRKHALELCAYSFDRVGLTTKAALIRNLSKKIK